MMAGDARARQDAAPAATMAAPRAVAESAEATHSLGTPAGVRIVRGHARDNGYAVAGRPAPSGAVIVAVPSVIDGDGRAVPPHPYQGPDAGWQLCQVERKASQNQNFVCSPYSYHPFGAYGHRPNGSYRAAGEAPIYMFAPNAKIIAIDPKD
jgi:hypothetical protein